MGVWFVLLLIGEVTLLTHLLAVVLYAILLAIILSFVCYLKGEPPRWRWGK
jgi:hypothetical protein